MVYTTVDHIHLHQTLKSCRVRLNVMIWTCLTTTSLDTLQEPIVSRLLLHGLVPDIGSTLASEDAWDPAVLVRNTL